MKILLLLLLIVGLYLNFSYAHFYDTIGQAHLTAPAHQTVTVLGQGPAVKYVALGDSLTAGVGVSNYQDSYPYLIAQKLSAKHSVQLINLAYPGDTSSQVLTNQLPKAIAQKPDLVTLLIGVNDIHNLKSEQEFKDNYLQIVTTLKQTKAKIYLALIPYLGSEKTVYFPYNLLLDWRTKQFNLVIKKIASDYQLNVIDLYSLPKVDNFYAADQFHPGVEGYQQWAKEVDVQ